MYQLSCHFEVSYIILWELRPSALGGRVHQSEPMCKAEVCAFTFNDTLVTSSLLYEDEFEVAVIVKDTTLNYSSKISKIQFLTIQ